MAETYFPGDVIVQGTLTVQGDKQKYERSDLDSSVGKYALDFGGWRMAGATPSLLPTTSSGSDLGLYTGAFATGNFYLSTGDIKASGAGATRYARYCFQLPVEYVALEAITLNLFAGMVTTIADGSCTLDAEVYKLGGSTLKSGSDLCTTSAININQTTFADRAFAISASTLSPGDWIDIRIAIAYVDTSTVTAVIPAIGLPEISLTVRG